MIGIIDRFEGNLVVVEIDGVTKNYPKSIFPEEAKPGDAVLISDCKAVIQKDETQQLRKEIEDLMNEVWED